VANSCDAVREDGRRGVCHELFVDVVPEFFVWLGQRAVR
jgi:hypothetical protein